MQLEMATQLQSRKKVTGSPSATAYSEQFLSGNDRLTPADQLEIYRVQFWLRHTSALLEDYPGLSGVIGQQAWERLSEAYLAEHPPDSFSLRNLGASLPEFVRQQSALPGCELPQPELCVEMARLEWCYTELFDAPDSTALDHDKLKAMPEAAWETARIVLNPAMRLLSLKFPVHELRRQLRAEQLAAADQRQSIPLPEPAPCHLVVYRDHQRQLYSKQVSELAFRLLEELATSTPLGLSSERVIGSYPVAEQQEQAERLQTSLGAWFADWGSRGWIVDVLSQSDG